MLFTVRLRNTLIKGEIKTTSCIDLFIENYNHMILNSLTSDSTNSKQGPGRQSCNGLDILGNDLKNHYGHEFAYALNLYPY